MRGQRGVTVVELVIVLIILAIVFGLAWPLAGALLADTAIKGAAEQVASAVRLTRQHAITQAVPHAIQFEDGGRSYRIVRDLPGEAETVEGPVTLAHGAVATGRPRLRFSPLGAAIPAGTVTVEVEGQRLAVVVNFPGRVRIGAPPRGR